MKNYNPIYIKSIKTIKKMKQKFIKKHPVKSLLFALLFLLNHVNLIAQNTSEKSNTSIPDIEKIYLHTDRSNYTIGEDLWYKAYSVYAYSNTIFDNSKLLYVELISPESKIVARHITKLDNGLGHGDFKLTDDSIGVKPGRYQIRAYTNWTRNFGDDFVFKKEIEIVGFNNNSGNTTEGKEALKLSESNSAANSLPISIQFFPEGGSLIEGVSSWVAFKAVDTNGYPVNVKGQVLDDKGNQVAQIESKHDGMGVFILTPEKDMQYIAELDNLYGEKTKTTIPKAQKQGYVLSAINRKGKHVVTIKTNQETLDKNPKASLTLIGTTRGVSYFEGTQALNETTYSFLLPDEGFPEGIAQITLYDEAMKPYSERLLYIEKENNVNVSLTTNKQQYTPNEKVVVNVSSKTTEGNPVLASFSVSSTEATTVNNETTNICSYFLMESDIKGSVYNPGHYFDRSNPKRLRDLDLLLRTQGWRDFLWKSLPDYKDEKKIQRRKRNCNSRESKRSRK